MEVCGSLVANNDYTEFRLKCIYCSVEVVLNNWKRFALHLKTAHYTADDKSYICYENKIATPLLNEAKHEYASNEIYSEDLLNETENAGPDTIECYSNENYVECSNHNDFDLICVPYSNKKEHFLSDKNLDSINTANISSDSSLDTLTEHDVGAEPMAKLDITFQHENPHLIHFIELYKAYVCLWNPADPNYKNEIERNRAYRSLINDLKVQINISYTKAKLRKTIQKLHSEYSAILTSNKTNRHKIHYLDSCEFLKYAGKDLESDKDPTKRHSLNLNFKEKNSLTSSFTTLYANFPQIYDSNNRQFQSIDTRRQAYQEIAKKLSESGDKVNETDVYLAIAKFRKWFYSALRRAKSRNALEMCTKSELHYLQKCNFMPTKMEKYMFVCGYCTQHFSTDYRLRTHMYNEHNDGELPYLCSKCPRRFEKLCEMDRHKLRQHYEKLHKCEYCNSAFAIAHDLIIHTRVHTGEKPYVCELCGKTFRLGLLLSYHIKGHHLNIRPFKCDICSKDFRKKMDLKNHVKAHSNIRDKKCNMCDKSFSSHSSLSRHRKLHFKNEKKICH